MTRDQQRAQRRAACALAAATVLASQRRSDGHRPLVGDREVDRLATLVLAAEGAR